MVRYARQQLAELEPGPGSPPDLSQLPAGCSFAARCGNVASRCRSEAPPVDGSGVTRLACWHPVQRMAEAG